MVSWFNFVSIPQKVFPSLGLRAKKKLKKWYEPVKGPPTQTDYQTNNPH